MPAVDGPISGDPADGLEPLVASDKLSQSTIDSLDATTFYNECRVFGRLKELNREEIAIKAYGYMVFDLSNERVQEHFAPFVKARGIMPANPTTADLISSFFQHFELEIPLMAIVKEWVPSNPNESFPAKLTQKDMNTLPRSLRNLRELHKSGIVVRDIQLSQYLGGPLVDFSCAWTIPHTLGPERGLRPRWTFECMAAWDLKCFQERILDRYNAMAGEVPHVRKQNLVAWRNDHVYGRLRTRPQMSGPFLPMLGQFEDPQPMKHRPAFDPAKFDWRAVQK
ncbi:hypothetical protein FBEOM_6391 [Fusarium beomiforme]|uniref:Uncharacterized protein n=1 Tax=Fusarium beomiforme TaxID=44412 RepID=A0A9P5AKS9_9HYPO|nr:hypothetical protein FBEOM_6391 [Fusarium beomiforme]